MVERAKTSAVRDAEIGAVSLVEGGPEESPSRRPGTPNRGSLTVEGGPEESPSRRPGTPNRGSLTVQGNTEGTFGK